MAAYDVTFHPRWWHQRTGVCFNERFFTDAAYRIEADLTMRRYLQNSFGACLIDDGPLVPRPLLDSDLLAGEYLQAALLGCDVLFSDDNLPEVICANLTDEQVLRLQPPDLDANPLWLSYEKQLQTLLEKHSRVECYLDLYGVQNLAFALRGQALFFDYYDQPDLADHLLDVCAQTLIAVAQKLRRYTSNISGGVSSVIQKTMPSAYLTSNCTVDMISPELYEEFLLPWDKKLARHFPPFAVHHCGAHCERFAALYCTIPNLSWLEAGAFSDFAAVRRTCGNLSLNLRYSPRDLLQKSPSEIERDVKNAFAATVCNGSSACTSMSCVGVDPQTPDENVTAFCRAVSAV